MCGGEGGGVWDAGACWMGGGRGFYVVLGKVWEVGEDGGVVALL